MTKGPALWREVNEDSVRDMFLAITNGSNIDPSSVLKQCKKSWGGTRSLFGRAELAAVALHDHLTGTFAEVCAGLVRASGPPRRGGGYGPRANYRYLVLTRYVSLFGLQDLDTSLETLRSLTSRFTSEFDIRPFLEAYPNQTIAYLDRWTSSSDHHVRRLVSEGTRPRLPWATHLTSLKDDPRSILPLLDALKSDRSRYVQRSVANNVADIWKDNPKIAYELLEEWREVSWPHCEWLIKHALRRPLSHGDRQALLLVA